MVKLLWSLVELVRWDEPWDIEADDPALLSRSGQ
jgi:hypothetical protein